MVLAVDNKDIRLSPFKFSVIPPPMCYETLEIANMKALETFSVTDSSIIYSLC